MNRPAGIIRALVGVIAFMQVVLMFAGCFNIRELDHPKITEPRDEELLMFADTARPSNTAELGTGTWRADYSGSSYKRQASYLDRGGYRLRIDEENGRLYLSMRDIRNLPKALAAGRDGLAIDFYQNNEEDFCIYYDDVLLPYIKVEQVKRELRLQYAHSLEKYYREKALKDVRKGIENNYRTLRIDPDTSLYVELIEKIEAKAFPSFLFVYQNCMQTLDSSYQECIGTLDDDPRSQGKKRSLEGKLESNKRRIENHGRRFASDLGRFNSFLNGSGSYARNRGPEVWNVYLAPFEKGGKDPGSAISIQFFKDTDPVIALHFDTVPANRFPIDARKVLPNQGDYYCADMSRFHFLVKQNRMKRLDYFYELNPSPILSNKEFTLYFNVNESTYRPTDIQPILKFLADSNYTVLRANIVGYSSVEGDEEINEELQKQRARVLLNVLQKASVDSIEGNIQMQENWELFYQQIKGTEYADWAGKPKDEIKQLLKEAETKKGFEPMLAKQRTATLQLTMSEKINKRQKRDYFMREYRNAADSIYCMCDMAEISMKKAAAMRAYVGKLVEQGIMSKEQACDLLENQSEPVLDLWDYYIMEEKSKEDKEPLCREPLDILLKAYGSALELCKQSSQYIKDASLIQARLYNEIIDGNIPPTAYCLLPVPEEKRYQELQVNKRYFAHYYPELVPKDCKVVEKDYYDQLRYIVDSTDKATEYDMYEYLSMSVERWQAGKGKYPAEGVDEKYMEERLQALGEKRFYVCGWNYYRLMLDYYMKRIQHFYMSEGVGDNTIRSLEALQKYFMQTAQAKSAVHSLNMARHFVWYAHESYSKEPIELAIELLEPHVENLDDDQKPNTDLFVYYVQLKAAIGERNLSEFLLEAREMLGDDNWCELFTGRFGLSYPAFYTGGEELHEQYCKTCRGKVLLYPNE